MEVRFFLLAQVFLLAQAFLLPFAIAEDPLHERIDAIVEAQQSGPVSEPASDLEFLRRVWLDLAGTIPSQEAVIAFLESDDPRRRPKVIDQLLESDRYAANMADKFDIMLMERRGTSDPWRSFLVDAFASNKPWDQIVREILSPDSENETTRGSAFFYTQRLERYGQNPDDMPGLVRNVGRMFLGVDVQCAQCHDHLFVDDYKQQDWQGLFAFVGNTSIRRDKDFPAIAEKPLAGKIEFASVFDMQPTSVGPRLPGGEEFDVPAFKKGEEYAIPPDRKTKEPGVPKFRTTELLAEQLPRRENPAFSRNAVNRLWWMMMGRGLVEPLDMHHSENPATHPELLDLLQTEFVEHDFDVRWLVRQLLLTRTYQRSSLLPDVPQEELPDQPSAYSTALERPLSAEQLLRSMLEATATIVDEEERIALFERFRKAFANPPKEPELAVNPTVKAALFLLNDPVIQSWLKLKEGNLIDQLSKLDDDASRIDALYLAVLTRRPDVEERQAAIAYLETADQQDTPGRLGSLAWALLTSAEFSVNH